MKKFLEVIKSQVPFELRRTSSWISIVLALLITGFVLAAGTKLFDLFYQFVHPYAPSLAKTIVAVLTYSLVLRLNLLTIFFAVISFFTIYRFIDKTFLKKIRNTPIFMEDFEFSNKGWLLNYWGSNSPDKTCRFENSELVFEANEDDLVDPRKEYGAYFDVVTGVYEKARYEVSCEIRADKGTTMGMRLWVHDTKGRNDIKYPANFYTPGTTLEEVKVGFTGTSSQALRIHLHIKPGRGKLYVDNVRVVKK